MVTSSSVGTSLRSARERARWSREALAYHSGLSAAAIAQIESGRRQDVRLASLVALARALNVSIDYLVGGRTSVERNLLEHRVLIYESDDQYLDFIVPFLREGMIRNDCTLVVTARRQTRLLRQALGDDAARIEFTDSATWYRSPAEALTNYRSFINAQFERGSPWIRVIGEPVWAGRSQPEAATWTRYESMLNLSLASSPATIICPYDARVVSAGTVADAYHTHPQVVTADDVSTSLTYREPEDFLLTTS
ncbi:MAG: sle [Ilumatobacteraceae bacterium]|jgi:transcriptional regulator with XRE-family HTH domain|nr:sle [Ilumatobacteraceae bacterium]